MNDLEVLRNVGVGGPVLLPCREAGLSEELHHAGTTIEAVHLEFFDSVVPPS